MPSLDTESALPPTRVWPAREGTAWALLEEDGQLRPSEAFRSLLGTLPEGPFARPPAVLEGAGFLPQDGLWVRRGLALRLERVEVPGGQLLGLTPLREEDGARREREVRLLRIAAHDIRGPLANIRSYAALALGGRMQLEPRLQRTLQVVRRNADKALALVEDTIDSLRLDRAGLPVEPEAVDVVAALQKAQARCEDRAEPSQATLEVHLPEGLPRVGAEPDRLVRVLQAPLEHLLVRAPAGSRLLLRGAVLPGQGVELSFLLQPGEAVASHPFAREVRILEERKLEDAVRLDVARRLVEAWGGALELVEGAGEGARGFLLRLPPPPPTAEQAPEDEDASGSFHA
jgi:signal transduction histidine kinase